MKPSTAKMSYAQLRLLPDDRQRHELVDGELLMTPAPKPRHQIVLNALNLALSTYVLQNRIGKVLIAPVDVVIDEHTVVEPDLLFIRTEHLSIIGEEAIHGAPDLVVEVLSPSTFYNDLRVKMRVYEQFGVEEYWIVDPEKETIEQYRLTGKKLELARQFAADASLESPLFPSLHLPVGTIFQ